jgi:hypothetical protein
MFVKCENDVYKNNVYHSNSHTKALVKFELKVTAPSNLEILYYRYKILDLRKYISSQTKIKTIYF